MKPDTQKQRRSIRLKEFDYTSAGAYFVTICAQNRECVFGEVVDGNMIANKTGEMVQSVWNDLPCRYHGVEIDVFMIMPNHVHGIISIVGAGPCACPINAESNKGQPRGVAPTRAAAYTQSSGNTPTSLSLPDIVHRFKSLTTTRYHRTMRENGGQQYPRHLWQRNYYEHVVRNEEELNRIRQYIVDNPLKWETDRENPAAVTVDDKEVWES